MMLQCAAAMGKSSTVPYIGTLPKYPPARKEAKVEQQKAGGTELDVMPEHGPWLDARYSQPSSTSKRDGWSVAKSGPDLYLVRIHRSGRKQRFHPLHRSCPMDAEFLTGERITKAWYTDVTKGPGFLVKDKWLDPVVRSENQWKGFTFLRMKADTLEALNLPIHIEAVETTENSMLRQPPYKPDDDMQVYVGQRGEMAVDSPRRGRPHGGVVGKLYLDGCLAASGTGTLSSAESQEVAVQQPVVSLTDQLPTVGYNRGGGVIERGVAVMEAMTLPSSSAAAVGPRSFQPLTEVWSLDAVDEWSMVSDDEDQNVNNEEDV